MTQKQPNPPPLGPRPPPPPRPPPRSVNSRPAVVILGLGHFAWLGRLDGQLAHVKAAQEGQLGTAHGGAGHGCRMWQGGRGAGGGHGRMVRAARVARNPSEGGSANNEATKR